MVRAFFTSDTHFSHRLVADHRRFATHEEHDEHLVQAWNAVVRPEDTVWHLGDVAMGGPGRWSRYVDRLNGSIHLIAGNHDPVHPMHRDSHQKQRVWLEHFASVQTLARRKLGGKYSVMLSHFPYSGEGQRGGVDRHTGYRLRNEGMPLLHGHTHDADQRLSFDGGTPMVHVGWDAWGRPVSLDEVLELLAEA